MATSADGVDPATHDCDFPSQDAAAGAQSQCMAPRPERSAVEDEDQPASCRRPLTSRRDAAQEPRQRLEPLLPLEQLRIVHPRQASHQRKACQLDPRQRNPRPAAGNRHVPAPGSVNEPTGATRRQGRGQAPLTELAQWPRPLAQQKGQATQAKQDPRQRRRATSFSPDEQGRTEFGRPRPSKNSLRGRSGPSADRSSIARG